MNSPSTFHTQIGTHHPIADSDCCNQAYFSNTTWQRPYDYGTIYYSPAERWEAHVDLDHHIFGVELTPGIVKTRINSADWQSHVSLSGSLYFVAAGGKIEVKKEQPMDFALVTVRKDAAERLFEEAGLTGPVPSIAYNIVDSSIERIAQRIRQQFMQNEPNIAPLASRLVVGAIDRLLNNKEVRRKPHRYKLAPHQVRTALDYIDENLESPLSVEKLAETIGLSGFFFAHAFTEMLGHSPHQYILDRRLSRAREMITKSKTSLADIAYSVGFSSQAHMTSTFGKRFGVTPRLFRQQQC